jgi:hypothetical protein
MFQVLGPKLGHLHSHVELTSSWPHGGHTSCTRICDVVFPIYLRTSQAEQTIMSATEIEPEPSSSGAPKLVFSDQCN